MELHNTYLYTSAPITSPWPSVHDFICIENVKVLMDAFGNKKKNKVLRKKEKNKQSIKTSSEHTHTFTK